MKHLMIAGLVLISCSTVAKSQSIYEANKCFNQMNPDVSPSSDMRTKVASTNTKAFLTSLGYHELILAVLSHRTTQCELKNKGEPFEAECPVGSTILADDLVQLQIDQHSLKSEKALSKLLEKKKSELRTAAVTMKAACE